LLPTEDLWRWTGLRFSPESGTWDITHLLSQSLSKACTGQSTNQNSTQDFMTVLMNTWHEDCYHLVIGNHRCLRADVKLGLKSEWQCDNIRVS
jgi:hypothetical protein